MLGLVTYGLDNGLKRHLGIPRLGQHAYDTVRRGRVRAIGTGAANKIPFFIVMGMGFDAEISRRSNQLALSSYFKTTCGVFLHYRPQTYHIRSGSDSVIIPAFIIAVTNSDQYRNNCIIAPGVRLDDGLLDLTVIRRVFCLNALPLLGRLFTGRLCESKNISRLRGAHFIIDRAALGLIRNYGEVYETGAVVEVVVRPQRLRVLVPASTPTA